MAKIKLINGDAKNYQLAADLMITDPPFEMPGHVVAEIINNYQVDHLILICSMRQLLEFSRRSDWTLNFDLILDIVAPKKSKSMHQPFYMHVHAVYFTRNKAKTRFSRADSRRADVYTNGYFPTIIKAPRERNDEHGHAKNVVAITDVLACFRVDSVIDVFAGSGTTALACVELDIDCTLIELDSNNCEHIKKTLSFLGHTV